MSACASVTSVTGNVAGGRSVRGDFGALSSVGGQGRALEARVCSKGKSLENLWVFCVLALGNLLVSAFAPTGIICSTCVCWELPNSIPDY